MRPVRLLLTTVCTAIMYIIVGRWKVLRVGGYLVSGIWLVAFCF